MFQSVGRAWKILGRASMGLGAALALGLYGPAMAQVTQEIGGQGTVDWAEQVVQAVGNWLAQPELA